MLTGKKIFRKLRHRKGHGVHSPFVYELISRVVEEKCFFYAFDEIEKNASSPSKATKEYGRFLFRLINHLRCRSVVQLGGDENKYISKALPQESSYRISENTPISDYPADLIIINEQREPIDIETLWPFIGQNTVIVIDSIAKNENNKRLWKTLSNHTRTVVSIDFYTIGMLFFDKTKTKKHYKLYFDYGKK